MTFNRTRILFKSKTSKKLHRIFNDEKTESEKIIMYTKMYPIVCI